MKKTSAFLLSLLMAGVITAGEAQAASPSIREPSVGVGVKKNVIGFSPIPAFLGQAVVDYERRLSSHVGLLATPYISFLQIDAPDWVEGDKFLTARGAGGEIAVNFYTGGRALNGFFLGPVVGYQFSSVSTKSRFGSGFGNIDAHVLKVGGRLGRQWFPAPWMVINLSGGAAYAHQLASSEVKVTSTSGTTSGRYLVGSVVPDLKFGLGVLF